MGSVSSGSAHRSCGLKGAKVALAAELGNVWYWIQWQEGCQIEAVLREAESSNTHLLLASQMLSGQRGNIEPQCARMRASLPCSGINREVIIG